MSRIKAVVFDVDGVLTNGQVSYDSEGREIKSFNIKDGQLIKYLKNKGLRFGCITGRESSMVTRRITELDVDFLAQGRHSKKASFLAFLEKFGLSARDVAYIGDDLIDASVLATCGVAICPADAPPYIKEMCNLVTQAKGGEGVLREVLDILIAQKEWQNEMLDYFKRH